MKIVEDYARKNNCKFISLSTMNFEAPDFYKKLGFQIDFERHGLEKDFVCYFMRKNL